MEHNADFSQRARGHEDSDPWRPSPMPGVERRILDRIGGEVARATSVVRYAPNSSFSPHTHTGGEEFLVLDGVFSDEHGDFGPGAYVRNPPGSKHQPHSGPGCTILVKLWQFDPQDDQVVRRAASDAFAPTTTSGVETQTLHASSTEDVTLERWEPGIALERAAPGGLELFVLAGGVEVEGERFEAHSWLRIPPGDTLRLSVVETATVWLKAGHLVDARTRFETAFKSTPP